MYVVTLFKVEVEILDWTTGNLKKNLSTYRFVFNNQRAYNCIAHNTFYTIFILILKNNFNVVNVNLKELFLNIQVWSMLLVNI